MKINVMGSEREVLFGVDAEFFIKKNGVVIPASQVIPGTKTSPHKLDNGVCHPDGLSLEVGCPPAKTPEGMIQNLLKVINEVREKFMDPQGVTFHDSSEIDVTDEAIAKQCTSADLEHGCSYEFFAWAEGGNSKKQKYEDSNHLRFSGFHIHLGFTEDQREGDLQIQDMACLARALDNLALRHRLGTTVDRSKQYGGYGAFRVKPYGIEYRCLDSSVFLQRDKLSRLLKMLSMTPSAFVKAGTCSTRFVSSYHHHDNRDLLECIRRWG